MICHNDAMIVRWGKDSPFNKWCWENWLSTHKGMNLDSHLTPYTNINSQWIRNPNIGADTTALLEESTGQ